MTGELRKDLVHLSVQKFIDFYLRRPVDGGLDEACEALEMLRNLAQVSPLFLIRLLTSILMNIVDPEG
jgi:hypothetical protein